MPRVPVSYGGFFAGVFILGIWLAMSSRKPVKYFNTCAVFWQGLHCRQQPGTMIYGLLSMCHVLSMINSFLCCRRHGKVVTCLPMSIQSLRFQLCCCMLQVLSRAQACTKKHACPCFRALLRLAFSSLCMPLNEFALGTLGV